MRTKQIEFTLERAETIELTGERAQSLYEKNNCSYPNVGDNVSIFTTHVSNRRQHRESVWVGKVIEVNPEEPRIVLEINKDWIGYIL